MQVRWVRHAVSAGDVRTNSWVTFSNELLLMDTLVFVNQQKTHSSTLCRHERTYQEHWLIGTNYERSSKDYMLSVCLDDDNDDMTFMLLSRIIFKYYI